MKLEQWRMMIKTKLHMKEMKLKEESSHGECESENRVHMDVFTREGHVNGGKNKNVALRVYR